MAADTIFFMDDMLHFRNRFASILSASSTAEGNQNHVRDTSFGPYWKPNDGNVNDEYLRCDGGSTTWLGAVSTTAYICVAYDARGADQNLLNLRYFPNDDFLLASSIVSFTLNKTRPTCDWASFTIPSNSNGLPKRYYELVQKQADRGGGTKTAKIYGWSMFSASGVFIESTGFPGDPFGSTRFTPRSKVFLRETAAGMTTKRSTFGSLDQEVMLRMQPGSLATVKKIREFLFNRAGLDGRAFYLQFEGMQYDAKVSFNMVRASRLSQTRVKLNEYNLELSVMTEPRSGD